MAMKILDNTESPKKGRAHYLIKIGGVSYSYCYIRKNAYSAFKDLFRNESSFRMDRGSSLANMSYYHSCSIDEVENSDFRIVILREPISRVASVFQNKFIQQLGFEDIFFNYRQITGSDPYTATFNDLIFQYLKNPLISLDVHLHPQSWHLYPIRYNAACEIKDLYEMSINIFGRTIADRYFKIKKNKSAGEQTETAYCLDVPASQLRSRYLETVWHFSSF